MKRSKKPYFEIMIIRAAPIATTICVRKPASFCLKVLSTPIMPPQTPARIILITRTIVE